MPGVEVVFESHLGEIMDALPEQIEQAMTGIGMMAETHAKEEITRQRAVDTGRLRNSITHSVSGNTAEIGTNVEYAAYVELGTSKMGARPYLRPAAENYTDEYKALAEAALKG